MICAGNNLTVETNDHHEQEQDEDVHVPPVGAGDDKPIVSNGDGVGVGEDDLSGSNANAPAVNEINNENVAPGPVPVPVPVGLGLPEPVAPAAAAAPAGPPIERLEAELFDFMAENQITHAAMHSLLGTLNTFSGKVLPTFPRNPRTLLTRYSSKTIFMKQTDSFVYIAIRESLDTLYKQNSEIKELINAADTIELAFNVDGLPLSGESLLVLPI